MRTIIWTPQIRQVLYESLVREFGPSDGWENETTPFKAGNPRIKDWDAFLNAFSIVAGAESGMAVLNQIRWALHKGAVDRGSVKMCSENTEAAKAAGFI